MQSKSIIYVITADCQKSPTSSDDVKDDEDKEDK